MAQRKARAKATGKRPGGKPPQPPQSGVRPNDQINLTDEESRIMPAGGKSFQQAYNVQAGVDTETLLIVTESVTTHANDKQESSGLRSGVRHMAYPSVDALPLGWILPVETSKLVVEFLVTST